MMLTFRIENKIIRRLLIAIIIILIVLIVIGFIAFHDADYSVLLADEKIILENGDIQVTDSKIKYVSENKKWFLVINIANSSEQDIDLGDYNIRLLDMNGKVVNILSGNALGIVPKNDKIVSSISFDTDISKVERIDIVKV